ncbi:MAG: hypothetical protein COA86_11120 [Kangiella sp.]|nr:MAG: hypothetical protein COA86_11120 [Kangiella sp.]
MINLLSTKKDAWQYLFFFLSLIFIIATIYEPYQLSWLLKVLPMLLLITIANKNLDWKYSKLFIVGLIFSVSGDFILDYFGKTGFIFGLGSFFIAHIFYLIYFGWWQWNAPKAGLALVILVSGGYVVSHLLPNLGALFYPVIGYMFILTLMAFASFFSIKSNRWFVLGGVSFVISDSILGINKFYFQFDASHILIMVSYYFAQFALVKGASKFKNVV